MLIGQPLEAADVEQLFRILDDPHPSPASKAVRALLSADSLWSYDQAATLWEKAIPAKRGRLLRLLRGRGGWDRVRADLLAASDPDLAVSGQGQSDLESWSQFAAARMWQGPSDDQLWDIKNALPVAQIWHELRQAIEFRVGLPTTPDHARA
jgi:hypothetical protein